MPTWLVELCIGGAIMGLVGLIYRNVTERIRKHEDWKETMPKSDEILTKSVHGEICHERNKEVMDAIAKSTDDLKVHFDLKVENVILTKLKEMNGGK